MPNAPTSLPDGCALPGVYGHPLEFFALFRRWPKSFLRNVVYTLIWNSFFALIFVSFAVLFEANAPFLRLLWVNFVFAQCIGTTIYLGMVALERLLPRIHRFGSAARTAWYAGVAIAGVFLGYPIAAAILGTDTKLSWLLSLRGGGSIALVALILTGIMLLIFLPRERAARAEATLARSEAQLAAAERETANARWKLLEAQVEPHFLYNTLAHVVSLIDAEPATAKRMLDHLIALLRSTASAATGNGTLAAQVAHLRAYLDILVLRMGRRLAYTIDVPADLGELEVPPMLLQPLVENAIKHGLEPAIDGGRIDVTARREGGRLVLSVVDTGRGFASTRSGSGTGTGLTNLRARLATRFGEAASLAITDRPGGGAQVTIALPIAATA